MSAHVLSRAGQSGARTQIKIGTGTDSRGGPVAVREDELLRVLHDQHARALWAYVVRLTNGDAGRAEDVVQETLETLLRAWRHPRVLDQSQGSARAWLFTVARRIVIDDWRSRHSRPEIVTADPPDLAVADGTDHAVDTMIVTAALSRLSADHRAVLFECYHRGASVAEAAETLGVPPGTVKSRTHYALRALRVVLQEMGGLP
jgi:RNA polymerase sigma-70 factor (ECF subfamily)